MGKADKKTGKFTIQRVSAKLLLFFVLILRGKIEETLNCHQIFDITRDDVNFKVVLLFLSYL